VNAVVQCSPSLVKVAVIRLCGPSARSLAPFVDIPEKLRQVIYGFHTFVGGGYEFDGQGTKGDLNSSMPF
jgi:hypothetical protein